MSIVERKKEVKTYNVYADCSCGGKYQRAEDFIVWNNNDTISDLSDDTFSYKYICDTCDDELITDIKYPFQEFIEI
jgi:hypothetical protein